MNTCMSRKQDNAKDAKIKKLEDTIKELTKELNGFTDSTDFEIGLASSGLFKCEQIAHFYKGGLPPPKIPEKYDNLYVLIVGGSIVQVGKTFDDITLLDTKYLVERKSIANLHCWVLVEPKREKIYIVKTIDLRPYVPLQYLYKSEIDPTVHYKRDELFGSYYRADVDTDVYWDTENSFRIEYFDGIQNNVFKGKQGLAASEILLEW